AADASLHPRVKLPSGGWITLETTEALTAIDVNPGSYTAATAIEETSLRTNLEAAQELGWQLRLRGLGGLIVIDFIPLNEPENIPQLLDVLTEEVARDAVPHTLL